MKFTLKGHVKITVRIIEDSEDHLNELLEISVEDSGVGISEENQCKLFKLFGFIQDSSQMNTQGIGLGLAIAK